MTEPTPPVEAAPDVPRETTPAPEPAPPAPVVGVTPVGVAPVVIGPSGLAEPAPQVTVDNLKADRDRLVLEAKQALSDLIKYSKVPEQAIANRMETALHALIEKVL